jgi:hypothetical protein
VVHFVRSFGEIREQFAIFLLGAKPEKVVRFGATSQLFDLCFAEHGAYG